jgi:hypothetical protein
VDRAVLAELQALQSQLTAVQGTIARLIQLDAITAAGKPLGDDQLDALFVRFQRQRVPLAVLAAEAGVVVDTLRRRFIATYGPAYRVRAMQQSNQAPDLLGDPPLPTLKGYSVEQVFAEWKNSGVTLEDLGARFGVSRERVRQVLSCHPGYEAERAQNTALRRLADMPTWMDRAWNLFKTDIVEFRRYCVEVGITVEIAYKQFKLRYPVEFAVLSQKYQEARRARAMAERRTPELIAAFERYKSDPKLSIDRMAYEMGLTCMGLWRQLKVAFGDEFRDISRTRARGSGRKQGSET